MPDHRWFISYHSPEDKPCFRGRGDLVSAVNRLAISFAGVPAAINAFVLTDSTLEAIAEGLGDAVTAAISAWRRTTGMYLSAKYQKPHPLRNGLLQIRRLYGREDVLRALGGMYGRIPSEDVFAYPWCSVREHFGRGERTPHCHIPLWKSRRILGTHKTIPESWTIRPDGQISLGDFVKTDSIDRMIGTYGQLTSLVTLFMPHGE